MAPSGLNGNQPLPVTTPYTVYQISYRGWKDALVPIELESFKKFLDLVDFYRNKQPDPNAPGTTENTPTNYLKFISSICTLYGWMGKNRSFYIS